jgi:hypothetical protein
MWYNTLELRMMKNQGSALRMVDLGFTFNDEDIAPWYLLRRTLSSIIFTEESLGLSFRAGIQWEEHAKIVLKQSASIRRIDTAHETRSTRERPALQGSSNDSCAESSPEVTAK